MTFRDYVRHFLEDPDMPDDMAEAILWEHTPFPLVRGAVDLDPYLAAYRAKAEA
jgi:hypothetical protein